MRKSRKVLSEVEIEKLSHDGRGIARIEGKTVFVDGALALETVDIEYLREKRDFAEARATHIHKASILRAQPPCPHYGVCGGCSLQHLETNAQIKAKEEQLLDLLKRIGHCAPETVLAPLQAETSHYRSKGRLSVRHVAKKGGTLVGFREKYSPRYIADINQCPILHEKVDALLIPLRELINTFSDPSSIAQVEVAAGDSDLALIFRNLTPLKNEDLGQLQAFGQSHACRIYLQPKGPDSVTLFYPEGESEYLSYALPKRGLKFSFYPTDFTQVNLSLNAKMIEQALSLLALSQDDIVLDLFCGLGNFSLPLAQETHHVIGVEGSEAMVLRARMNAENNQLSNTEFYAANLEEPDFLTQFKSRNINKMLIDPPRAGAVTVMKEMASLMPERIVYVSCDPATLARDAGILVNEFGYFFEAAGVMDMFPHTAHVESIALFTRR